ncbi:hypothetical protein HK097_008126 [Rhizophlyctis rosea]|uniref:Uncharacterized protein n=1 Tax=Rhizophlyctis rosea TaxID=64517 RepID=A0AAD5SQ56_9FUNG|nr:hypothetical protein HK097_008126 [Rhizophlyctis rosea]
MDAWEELWENPVEWKEAVDGMLKKHQEELENLIGEVERMHAAEKLKREKLKQSAPTLLRDWKVGGPGEGFVAEAVNSIRQLEATNAPGRLSKALQQPKGVPLELLNAPWFKLFSAVVNTADLKLEDLATTVESESPIDKVSHDYVDANASEYARSRRDPSDPIAEVSNHLQGRNKGKEVAREDAAKEGEREVSVPKPRNIFAISRSAMYPALRAKEAEMVEQMQLMNIHRGAAGSAGRCEKQSN